VILCVALSLLGLSGGTKRYVTDHVEAARDTTLFYVIENGWLHLVRDQMPNAGAGSLYYVNPAPILVFFISNAGKRKFNWESNGMNLRTLFL